MSKQNETAIRKQIQVALSGEGCRMFRNNVGHYEDKYGNHITYGLGTGTSDLVGFTIRAITPDMVGKVTAIFTAVEVKSADGRTTPEQEQFLKAVTDMGGIAFVARSKEEAISKLGEFK